MAETCTFTDPAEMVESVPGKKCLPELEQMSFVLLHTRLQSEHLGSTPRGGDTVLFGQVGHFVQPRQAVRYQIKWHGGVWPKAIMSCVMVCFKQHKESDIQL